MSYNSDSIDFKQFIEDKNLKIFNDKNLKIIYIYFIFIMFISNLIEQYSNLNKILLSEPESGGKKSKKQRKVKKQRKTKKRIYGGNILGNIVEEDKKNQRIFL